MSEKQFTFNGKEIIQDKQVWCMANSEHCADVISTAMNELHEENQKLLDEKNYSERKKCEYFNKWNNAHLDNIQLRQENEQLRNRINDWHQRTFKAHEYFNILEKVIDEVCDNDISNQIWK